MKWLILALCAILCSCWPHERIGGRVSVDPDTQEVTPLNAEACLYLAYENLCLGNTQKARELIIKSSKHPTEDLLIKEELLTIDTLVAIEEKNWENAIALNRKLATVKAMQEHPSGSEQLAYRLHRRIRGASIALRNHLATFEEFMILKEKGLITPQNLNDLNQKWKVHIKYQFGPQMKTKTFQLSQ